MTPRTSPGGGPFEPPAGLRFYLLARGESGVTTPSARRTLPTRSSLLVKERNPDGAKLQIKDAHGVLVRELQGPAEAGLTA